MQTSESKKIPNVEHFFFKEIIQVYTFYILTYNNKQTKIEVCKFMYDHVDTIFAWGGRKEWGGRTGS
jgi:hypothetical protein